MRSHEIRWKGAANRLDAGESQELRHDIALRFKDYGILPRCQRCGLSCKQAGVSPNSPLTGFYCPMDRGKDN